ncbi:hypothetical protein [Faecalispora jeddahensis]|uniref:hypothetical protein n=1 Tax=Faecalispora jeddahensis TaxID=1414721 RepID=UPI0018996E64|nr:hypothetical protein [Faecalispora jeddahensis]
MESTTTNNFIDHFGGRLWYACSSGWPIYTFRGRNHHLDESIAEYEAVMMASLKQGKNLVIKTFPAVELYPDPNAVY